MWGAASAANDKTPKNFLVCSLVSSSNPDNALTIIFDPGAPVSKQIENFISATNKEFDKIKRSKYVDAYLRKIGITKNPDGSITL